MATETQRCIRVIVNGKAAADPLLRPAIATIRDEGHRVDVRVTWEGGDAARYAAEATNDRKPDCIPVECAESCSHRVATHTAASMKN